MLCGSQPRINMLCKTTSSNGVYRQHLKTSWESLVVQLWSSAVPRCQNWARRSTLQRPAIALFDASAFCLCVYASKGGAFCFWQCVFTSRRIVGEVFWTLGGGEIVCWRSRRSRGDSILQQWCIYTKRSFRVTVLKPVVARSIMCAVFFVFVFFAKSLALFLWGHYIRKSSLSLLPAVKCRGLSWMTGWCLGSFCFKERDVVGYAPVWRVFELLQTRRASYSVPKAPTMAWFSW